LPFSEDSGTPAKYEAKYLPLPYMELRYPRLARNTLENRNGHEVTERLHSRASPNTNTVLAQYRTLRPRFLNYLVEGEEVDQNGQKCVGWKRRAVWATDSTPFVVVAYCSKHFPIDEAGDPEPGAHDSNLENLLAASAKAASRYFRTSPRFRNLPQDLKTYPRAFWTAANCMPPSKVGDELGVEHDVPDESAREALANQDVSDSPARSIILSLACPSDPLNPLQTYTISDIVRAAEHVIVIVGNMKKPWDEHALRVWGRRVWTFPEIVLTTVGT
jgi:hypothetical protein